MYEFQAIGPGIKQTWRRRLPSRQVIRLGRAPKDGWAVPWDMRISREHADLILEGGALRVRRLLSARNAIYFHGQPAEEFTVGPGEDFRIGQTVFRLDALSAEQPEAWPQASPPPAGAKPSWSDFPPGSERARLQQILAVWDEEETRLESQAEAPPSPTAGAALFDLDNLDGRALGEYELTDQVHRGATGQVLKARHAYLDRWAAIQILASSGCTDEAKARFHRKAVLTAGLDHPNLARVYDAGRIGSVHYLVTEFIDGGTLAKRLVRQRLELATAVDYVIQAARALGHAHQRQIVHRDVQPAHLLLSDQGVIKVIGWGRAWRPGLSFVAPYEGPGRLLGTPGFLAPEQFVDSRQVDQRTDIYALGCTLYALLASQAILPPDWRHETRTTQGPAAAPPLSAVRPEVPEALEQVYQRMLAHAPEDRWASMLQLIDALEQAGCSGPSGNP